MTASAIGPWMYLRGRTQAPPNTSDFFEYDLRVLARTDPFADPNGDGSVDAADFTMLQDGTGRIAGVGIAEWQAQFGETAPDMDAMDASLNTALATLVPEPGSMSLAILGLLLLGLASRKTQPTS